MVFYIITIKKFCGKGGPFMHLQESGEMYLETILILSKSGKDVRSVDVSEYMGFSKPSVSRALSILKKDGYVEGRTPGADRRGACSG